MMVMVVVVVVVVVIMMILAQYPSSHCTLPSKKHLACPARHHYLIARLGLVSRETPSEERCVSELHTAWRVRQHFKHLI